LVKKSQQAKKYHGVRIPIKAMIHSAIFKGLVMISDKIIKMEKAKEGR